MRKVMVKKIVVISILVTIAVSLVLIFITKKDNTKTKVVTQIVSNESPQDNELVFYNLERNLPEQREDNNQPTQEMSTIPCTTDIVCRVKNKNLENPYDVIINSSNEDLNSGAISEKDRLDAERFSESLELGPKSNQKNEVLDMLDQLSNIQEDLDIHKSKAQEQPK